LLASTDLQYFAYTYVRALTELYVVDGLK